MNWACWKQCSVHNLLLDWLFCTCSFFCVLNHLCNLRSYCRLTPYYRTSWGFRVHWLQAAETKAARRKVNFKYSSERGLRYGYSLLNWGHANSCEVTFLSCAGAACPCSHPAGHVLVWAGDGGGESGRGIVSAGVAQPAIPAWVQPSQGPGTCLLQRFLFIYGLFHDFI